MDSLINRRRTLKGKVTRILNNVTKDTEGEYSMEIGINLELSLKQIETLTSEACVLLEQFSELCTDEEYKDIESEFNEIFDKLDKLNVKILKFIRTSNAVESNVTSSVHTCSTEQHNYKVKLPVLELPVFSGNLTTWLSFYDLFVATVHTNKQLTNSQKLQYLKSSIKGEAAILLQSIQICDQNYEQAWNILLNRYQNETDIIYANLEKLFNQPQVSNESAQQIRKLIDTTSECIEALKFLKQPVEHWDTILVFLIRKKLDSVSVREWEMNRDKSGLRTFAQFKEFLENRAHALSSLGLYKPKAPPAKQDQNKWGKSTNTSNTHVAFKQHCVFCNQDSHTIYKCAQFLNMPVSERVNTVKAKNLCFNCLRAKHSTKTCYARTCFKCNSKHHTLLHYDRSTTFEDPKTISSVQQSVALDSTSKSECKEDQHASLSCAKDPTDNSNVLLATAIISVEDKTKCKHSCRALIDCGSQLSFITEDCVQRLHLKRYSTNVSVSGISSLSVGRSLCAVKLNIASNFNSETFSVEAFVLPKVTSNLPQIWYDVSQWKHLENLKLADPKFNMPSKIDILLGADVFPEIICSRKIQGPFGSPVALDSAFGWLVSGKVIGVNKNISAIHHSFVEYDSALEKFWNLEELPKANVLTPEERNCELHFEATHTRDNSGRYVVSLPFRESSPCLGASRDIAIRRLTSVEKRLNKDQYDKYVQFMNKYIELGHMAIIPEHELLPDNSKLCYLPHHSVQKVNECSKKFRVVFDASAKTSSGVSLNDKLMVGPTIQDSIAPLLLRFRKHKVAITADIVKMYRQIRVRDEDTNYQRIVWRNSPDDKIRDYKLLTVTYGTSCAPYLATKCLQQVALDENKLFPTASIAVLRDFYVDDFISGAETTESALKLQNETIEMLRRAGFDLSKWASNDPELLKNIPQEKRETSVPLGLEDEDSIKTLGVLWHPSSDEFLFKVTMPAHAEETTKRSLLSTVAKIYDPLGWLAPVTIRGKILFQCLWKEKLDWDEPVPKSIQAQWTKLWNDLQNIENIRIPRCVISDETLHYELHGFSDASELAYSCCVYLRCVTNEGNISVNLLAAKTKVSPIKTVSIPRLELCGALLLTKLMNFVANNSQLNVNVQQCWTDSTVVLSWIESHPSKWKTFVANRVSKIQESHPRKLWRHVSTGDNPADCATKGMLPSDLIQHSLWWNGPQFLHDITLPQENIFHNDEEAFKEQKTKSQVVYSVARDQSILERFSSLTKVKRITALCSRFAYNLRVSSNLRKTGFITSEELKTSLMLWVKIVQESEFQSEIHDLKSKSALSSKSNILSLNPFLDELGILRVGGRLHHAALKESQKFPILLPKNHLLTRLIIKHFHLSGLHAGPQLVQASISREFWIISSRDVIRREIKKCVTCFRHHAQTVQQLMGNLPVARVNPSRAFLQSGVDYAGPFTLKAAKGRNITFKGYIALFICFSTRAIHLELVSDISTNAFLAALQRFIARRGNCSDLYSDCGTNFVGAKRKLKEYMQLAKSNEYNEKISQYLSNNGINWHLNPPSAPHMGGLWEAGVKSVKFHLHRIIGNVNLTFEEFYTVLTQVEACLNSRPLCPMSSDPSDMCVLTPGHFLIGAPLTSYPEPDHTSTPINRLTRWQLLQKLVQHFWKRWQGEYLSKLQQRPKWLKSTPNLNIGDLVLVKETNLPPLKWQMGRISEIHPGKDSLVRVVTLKTCEGFLKRPIHKLCKLPLD